MYVIIKHNLSYVHRAWYSSSYAQHLGSSKLYGRSRAWVSEICLQFIHTGDDRLIPIINSDRELECPFSDGNISPSQLDQPKENLVLDSGTNEEYDSLSIVGIRLYW